MKEVTIALFRGAKQEQQWVVVNHITGETKKEPSARAACITARRWKQRGFNVCRENPVKLVLENLDGSVTILSAICLERSDGKIEYMVIPEGEK